MYCTSAIGLAITPAYKNPELPLHRLCAKLVFAYQALFQQNMYGCMPVSYTFSLFLNKCR